MTNKQSPATEVLIVTTTCFVLSAIFMTIILQNVKTTQYNTLKSSAMLLKSNANIYSLEHTKKTVSLKELIDEGLISKIKNPFNQKENCDEYESKIEYNGSKSISTLKCGNYLIKNMKDKEKYVIYKVSPWSEKEYINSVIELGYNYFKNNQEVFDDYYEESIFIYAFNKKNSTNYRYISEIPDKYNVFDKLLYRKRIKIKEI